jgi:transcriptional regulator with PAS, ATPase and Fis domain
MNGTPLDSLPHVSTELEWKYSRSMNAVTAAPPSEDVVYTASAEVRERHEWLEARVQSICDSHDQREKDIVRPVGQSHSWRDVLRKALRVASAETTVLLEGESGTGKEVIARLIHEASSRRSGPFVAMNCAAVPDTLLESELFGYERGAFTGADRTKPGQIEQASGGVLFLDEVCEMTAVAQAKLLRVLQEREFQRLGGTRIVKASVRIIAATNQHLHGAVERGAFREDLFYRLGVFDIRLPPLRERPDDIPLLADAFLQDFRMSITPPPIGFTPEAIDALVAYDWPGNVRHLRNVLERASILCDGGVITSRHLNLPKHIDTARESRSNLDAVERRTIEHVMTQTHWNKSRAADRLGITRTQLYGRLRKHDLQSPRVR